MMDNLPYWLFDIFSVLIMTNTITILFIDKEFVKFKVSLLKWCLLLGTLSFIMINPPQNDLLDIFDDLLSISSVVLIAIYSYGYFASKISGGSIIRAVLLLPLYEYHPKNGVELTINRINGRVVDVSCHPSDSELFERLSEFADLDNIRTDSSNCLTFNEFRELEPSVAREYIRKNCINIWYHHDLDTMECYFRAAKEYSYRGESK